MRKDRSSKLLVLALSVVLVGFVVENAFMFWSDRRLQAESSGLQHNALPSIEELSRARSGGLEIAACLGSGGDVTSTSRCVRRASGHVDDALRTYEALPMYPDEPAVAAEVDRSRAALGRLLADVADPARATAVDKAYGELQRMDAALRELILLNANRAFGHAARIDKVRAHSALFEFLLGAAALAVAAVATLLGLRAKHAHTRFLEERARELDLFAATVAHDLVGPLTSVGMAMPLIKERHPDDAHTQQLAERALTGVRRVRTLVEGLLAFARAGATPGGGSADVRATLEGVMHELGDFAQSEKVELSLERADAATVACAGGVLSSIVSNLVRNAIKHMGDSEPRRVGVRALADGGRVRIEVEDTGPGVPLAAREAIFEPHVRLTAEKPGLGLGLATVKRLAVAHGGRVGVQAAPVRGALFFVELPRADATPARQSA